MAKDAGFHTDLRGTTLTCPACGATALMDEVEIWHHWLDQRRREKLLAQFAPAPDDPLNNGAPK